MVSMYRGEHLLIHRETWCGHVTQTTRRGVWIECSPQDTRNEACARCGLCGGAGKSHTKRWIPIANSTAFTPGERVLVERHRLNEALAASIVFGIPLLVMFATLLYRGYADPESVDSLETVCITVGALGAGCMPAWGIDLLFRRWYPAAVSRIEDTVSAENIE
jgi:hypothetical protein